MPLFRTPRSSARSISPLNDIPAPRIRIEALESRMLLAADSISVFIGGAAAKAVQFIDPNGTRAIMHMTGQGNATVTFSGTNLAQGPSPAGVLVSGSDITLASIALTNTGLTTMFYVSTIGRNSVTLGGITSDGVVNSIIAPGVVVTGDITTAGWVHDIELAGAQDGTISTGPAHINGGLKVSIGSVSDESLTSDIRINELTAGQWLNTTGAAESITAPQVLTMRVKGAFAPDLSIPGIRGAQVSLQTFVAGALTGGTWNVNGKTHILSAGSIAGWSGTFNGAIDSFHVTHNATMNLTAEMVGSMTIGGVLAGSTVSLTQPLSSVAFDLNSLYVGGAINDSTIESAGSIRAFSAQSLTTSGLYVGLVNPALPATTSDFANTAEIRTLVLRRSAGASFANSNIAAYDLGTVTLGAVQTSNGGTPFGVAGHSIQSITLVDQTTRRSAHESNVPSTAAFSQLLVSRGIAQGDLVVEIA